MGAMDRRALISTVNNETPDTTPVTQPCEEVGRYF